MQSLFRKSLNCIQGHPCLVILSLLQLFKAHFWLWWSIFKNSAICKCGQSLFWNVGQYGYLVWVVIMVWAFWRRTSCRSDDKNPFRCWDKRSGMVDNVGSLEEKDTLLPGNLGISHLNKCELHIHVLSDDKNPVPSQPTFFNAMDLPTIHSSESWKIQNFNLSSPVLNPIREGSIWWIWTAWKKI